MIFKAQFNARERYRTHKIKLSLFTILILTACQAPPPPAFPIEEASRNDANYYGASKIASNCARFEIQMPSQTHDSEILTRLKNAGYDNEEIKNIRRRFLNRSRHEKYFQIYLRPIPLDPKQTDYYCHVGDYERERGSAISQMLREV